MPLQFTTNSDAHLQAVGLSETTLVELLENVGLVPGGSDTELQFRNNGQFGGATGTVWDDANSALTVNGTASGKWALNINPGLDGSGFNMGMVWVGQPSFPTNFHTNSIRIVDETDASITGQTAGMQVSMTCAGGATSRDNKVAFRADIGRTGADGLSSANSDDVAAIISAGVSTNCGGTSLVPKGSMFAINTISAATSAATFLGGLYGIEIDISAAAGSSMVNKNGIRIGNISDDVQGTLEDAGICIVADPTAIGWRDGILFNKPSSDFGGPVNSTNGTLLHAKADQAWTVANGIDISGPTITNYAFKSTGFAVNGGGVLILSGGTSGASPSPQITFGSYLDTSGGVSTSHIDLFGQAYGFGISSSQLNYISGGIHAFYNSGDLANATAEIWGTPKLPSYAKASLPSAATAGKMIYVTDETGGAVPAFSDGSNWRRVTDRNVVS